MSHSRCGCESQRNVSLSKEPPILPHRWDSNRPAGWQVLGPGRASRPLIFMAISMALFVFLREKFCSTGFEKYGKENRKEMRERESGGRKTGRKETEGEKEKKNQENNNTVKSG